jgi:hypothetical protein
MSSSYYLLCMSHDPATVAVELSDPNDLPTAEWIKEHHPNCDFVVSRVSGAPVEFGCPAINTTSCAHRDIQWVDADWLRILMIAQDARAADIKKICERSAIRCWDFGRLHRLRLEL